MVCAKSGLHGDGLREAVGLPHGNLPANLSMEEYCAQLATECTPDASVSRECFSIAGIEDKPAIGKRD